VPSGDSSVRAAALTTTVLATALDHLATGIAISDGNGSGIAFNRAARKLCGRFRKVTISEDRRGARMAAKATDLESVVRRLIADQNGSMAAVTVAAQTSLNKLHLFVFPLACDEAPNAVAVYMCDPNRRLKPREEVLRHLYHLTAAEAKVACELVNGCTIEESARRLDIKINTARSHLKKIFAKTRTTRQGEMMRILITSLAPIELPD
jgi:DNA-binding CsgD family transcriptional regulator